MLQESKQILMLSMVSSADENALLSIIEFNHRRIEELLIKKKIHAENRSDIVPSNTTGHELMSEDKFSSKTVVLHLIPKENEPVLNPLISGNGIVPECIAIKSNGEAHKMSNIIADHSIKTMQKDCTADQLSTNPSIKSGNLHGENHTSFNDADSSQIMSNGNIIPGLGASTDPSIDSISVVSDHGPISSSAQVPSNNIWSVNKEGKRRKKAISSSTSDEFTSRSRNPSKRRRCISSSFLALPEHNFDKSENCLPKSTDKSSSAESPGKYGKMGYLLNFPKEPLLNVPSTYVSCWVHCPLVLSRQAPCFPKSQFVKHLCEHHGFSAGTVNYKDRQVVCICHACETVVPYNYKHKVEHLTNRCNSGWQQQFYLFMEENQDIFGIANFNAPVVISPGIQNMFKSSSRHPHLDTLTWKDVNNVQFCYHFCSFCNAFIEDASKSVTVHASSLSHRINVRRAGIPVE